MCLPAILLTNLTQHLLSIRLYRTSMHLCEQQRGKILLRRKHGFCGHEVSKAEAGCEAGVGSRERCRHCPDGAAAAPGLAAAPQRSRSSGRGGKPKPRLSEPRGAMQGTSRSLTATAAALLGPGATGKQRWGRER